jgi:group I intron endonuclease
MFYVYSITNKINGKIYIGKATDLQSRWAAHLATAKRPTYEKHYLIHRAIAKYGEDNFSFTEIESLNSEQESLDREMFWIAQYKSNVCRYGSNYGYNLTDGGDGSSGYKHTKESKQIMSLLKQGYMMAKIILIGTKSLQRKLVKQYLKLELENYLVRVITSLN